MRLLYLTALCLAITGCGDDRDPGTSNADPFGAVPLTQEVHDPSLTGKVNLVRDKFGIVHIYAGSSDDAAFAQGFITAHDRLAQMDVLRRFGSGTLAESFGGLDASVIDTDIRMRVHRMRPLAEESYALLQASSDPADRALVRTLQRFSDGVNAFVQEYVTTDRWSIDAAVTATFDPKTFVPWSPVDSLVLGRFQALSLSFTVEFELAMSELYQKVGQTFDAAGAGQPAEILARRGIGADLLRVASVGRAPTIDGFPNVTTDTGTRSDAGRGGRARAPARSATAATSRRPVLPPELYDQVRTMFPSNHRTGAFGAFGPETLMSPRAGSNNWAVAPSHAGGKTLLATDQHLQLSNPSLFYPIHLIIEADTEALGVTFPGIPGILLGTNGNVAWSGTVAYHDVNDVYQETVAPCGNTDCVTFRGNQVPIETWSETIKVGVLGNILSERTVTFERVPHHGPILPTVRDGAIVPRTGATALSVRFTGYQPSFEIRAFWDLMRAKDVDQAFASLRSFHHGGQNWTMIDNSGNIGWTSNVEIPLRAPNATTWNGRTNPTGNAPWFVLPGDGSAEWEGRMSSRYVPHAINPPSGYLATANSDPTGQTFDNDALNQPLVDGRPLYAGVGYAPGLRLERISSELDALLARGSVTLTDLAKLQHDASSTMGAKIVPVLSAALAYASNSAGAPADVVSYLATLSVGQRVRLVEAGTLLTTWSFATPAAVAPESTAAEITNSAATTVFNTWMHFFIAATFDDELTRAGFDRATLDDARLARMVYAVLVEPAGAIQSATTQQPILCDRLGVAGPDDSCTKMQLMAMVSALDHLASSEGYGSADPNTWRWGAKHRLAIASVLPNPALTLPGAAEGLGSGFPRDGDTFVINRADAGWQDLDFAQSSDGAAQRFLVEAEPGQKMKVKWQLPGGTVFDSRSAHYRDLLDNYYLKQVHFDVPFELPEIVSAGEERWTFQ
ncbi:MAG: penicillin acylase family protein [Kofleriaceae bacterium]